MPSSSSTRTYRASPTTSAGNSFLEMGFAHVLDIPIYLMQDVPDSNYRSEMLAMDPIVINGDLSGIPADMSTDLRAAVG